MWRLLRLLELGGLLEQLLAQNFLKKRKQRSHGHYGTCLEFVQVTDLSLAPFGLDTVDTSYKRESVCSGFTYGGEHRPGVAHCVCEAASGLENKAGDTQSLPCSHSYWYLLLSFECLRPALSKGTGDWKGLCFPLEVV